MYDSGVEGCEMEGLEFGCADRFCEDVGAGLVVSMGYGGEYIPDGCIPD